MSSPVLVFHYLNEDSLRVSSLSLSKYVAYFILTSYRFRTLPLFYTFSKPRYYPHFTFLYQFHVSCPQSILFICTFSSLIFLINFPQFPVLSRFFFVSLWPHTSHTMYTKVIFVKETWSAQCDFLYITVWGEKRERNNINCFNCSNCTLNLFSLTVIMGLIVVCVHERLLNIREK